MDLVKIESGRVELRQEPVECREVLNEIANAQRPAAEAKGLAFSIDAPDADVVVNTDRRAVHQILLNLTNNAIRFTEQGAVRLQLRERDTDGRCVEFSIIDTGVGIRTEDQERLFQAFRQVGATSIQRYEGTGLGLHLSRKLAELLSGRVTFESEFGKGSTFRLTLNQR